MPPPPPRPWGPPSWPPRTTPSPSRRTVLAMAPAAAMDITLPVPLVVSEAINEYLLAHVVRVGSDGCMKAIDGARHVRVGPASLDLRRGLWEYANRPLQPGEVLRRTCAILGCVAPAHRVAETRQTWGKRLGDGLDWRQQQSA